MVTFMDAVQATMWPLSMSLRADGQSPPFRHVQMEDAREKRYCRTYDSYTQFKQNIDRNMRQLAILNCVYLPWVTHMTGKIGSNNWISSHRIQ